uniref:Uncharacterized protein n=1 Tax=Amphimedon queenslandica TaxID=400682 RepID=A0A1X7V4J2_AMPQE
MKYSALSIIQSINAIRINTTEVKKCVDMAITASYMKYSGSFIISSSDRLHFLLIRYLITSN